MRWWQLLLVIVLGVLIGLWISPGRGLDSPHSHVNLSPYSTVYGD